MRYGKEVCTSHYITLDQISEVVLEAIRRQAIFAKHCRTGYRNLLMEAQQLRDEEEIAQQKEKAEQAQKRLTQLDLIIPKLLEQNAVGVISDERFAAMMKDYKAEQTELRTTISEYETQKTKQSEEVDNIQRHIELVEKVHRHKAPECPHPEPPDRPNRGIPTGQRQGWLPHPNDNHLLPLHWKSRAGTDGHDQPDADRRIRSGFNTPPRS